VLQRVVTGATSVVSDLAFILALLFFLILDSSSFRVGWPPPPRSVRTWSRR
jgi:predicted PurR-regulated permease PerM